MLQNLGPIRRVSRHLATKNDTRRPKLQPPGRVSQTNLPDESRDRFSVPKFSPARNWRGVPDAEKEPRSYTGKTPRLWGAPLGEGPLRDRYEGGSVAKVPVVRGEGACGEGPQYEPLSPPQAEPSLVVGGRGRGRVDPAPRSGQKFGSDRLSGRLYGTFSGCCFFRIGSIRPICP